MSWRHSDFRHASHINRRSFLAGAGSLALTASCSLNAIGAVRLHPKFSDNPFQLGVASGDPTPDGIVLWTRLAPKPLEGGGMPPDAVQVSWQIAEDEGMTKVVQQGIEIATPEWGHAIHVEAYGLQPGRSYWYQFRAGNEVSPKGRTRTAPAVENIAPLKFAFASCQHFETGYYTAYEHMLRENPDVVFHLGDYIYEKAGTEGKVRKHVGPELFSVADYRNRYAQYRTDPALQAMHAAAPWIVTWDDHEVANNYAGAISEKEGVLPAEFLKQRAAAYQAYYEHMPLRKSSIPAGADMHLYRQLGWGQLADFFVLDTRQYRSDQPCGDGGKPACPEVFDPVRTILGEPQRKWLLEGLGASRKKWNVLAQQVMMARVGSKKENEIIYGMDCWPGYEMDRRRVLKHLHERQIKNTVVMTGDIHSHWANDLIADFDNLGSPIVASEFVGTSISSSGDGRPGEEYFKKIAAENPFVKFQNMERGYVSCTITPQEWRTDHRVVEYVSRKGAPLLTRASFVVEAGKPGIEKA